MKDDGLYAGDTKVEIDTVKKVYKLESGSYVVKSGTEIKLDKSIAITGKVNVTVEEDAILGLADTGDFINAPLEVAYGGDLTVDGSGTITNNGKQYCAICVTIGPNSSPYNKDDDNDIAKLTVNGDLTIIGTYYGISGNGARSGTEITINGGKISATSGTGIYHPQDGTMTITKGEIVGTHNGIEIRAGSLTVTGGTISSTAKSYSAVSNGNGTTTVGAGIAVAQHDTNKNISLNVGGGEISGVVGLSVTNPNGKESNSNLI